MTERTITLDKRFREEYSYLFRAMTQAGITHAESHTETRFRVYTAETGANQCVLTAHLAEILLTPFRYRYFVANALCPTTPWQYAMLFATMNVDGAREYVRMAELIQPLSELHLDATFNFGMGEFKQRWARPAALLKDFAATAPTESEMAEFVACIMDATPARTQRKVRFYLSDDPAIKALQSFAYFGQPMPPFPNCSEEVKRIIGKIKNS